jgi:nucleotide-binding universal stress UspA family protein
VDKFVVGVDGSDGSRGALRWAVDEARVHGAEVVALHAWQVPIAPPGVTPVPTLDVASVIAEIGEGAEQLVNAVVKEVVGDETEVTVTAVAVEGPPAPSLIDAARDADLLVVGSRGLGGFTALLLGSVGHYCAQHAPCPVVIHRPRDDSA